MAPRNVIYITRSRPEPQRDRRVETTLAVVGAAAIVGFACLVRAIFAVRPTVEAERVTAPTSQPCVGVRP